MSEDRTRASGYVLSAERLRRLFFVGWVCLLPAIVLLVVMHLYWSTTSLAVFFAVMFAALGGVFHDRLEERGIWMLAGVFAIVLFPVYVLLVWHAPWSGGVLVVIDAIAAVAVLGLTVRVLSSVIVHSRKRDRSVS